MIHLTQKNIVLAFAENDGKSMLVYRDAQGFVKMVASVEDAAEALVIAAGLVEQLSKQVAQSIGAGPVVQPARAG